MSNIPTISLAAEQVGQIGSFPLMNSVVATITTSVVVLVFTFLVRRNAGVVPSRLQSLVELPMEFFLGQLTTSLGSEKLAKRAVVFMMSLCLFLLVANNFGLIPLLGAIVNSEGAAIFRTPSSDYSLPIALALSTILFMHIFAFSISPLRHIGNFIKIGPFFKIKNLNDFIMAVVGFFLGLLDIVGEIGKIISLSTRLFGNVFAGEVILIIISGLAFFTQFFVPIPFIILSVTSSIIQAMVFPLLASLFMGGLVKGVTEEA